MTPRRLLPFIALALCLVGFAYAQSGDDIDFNKARQLRQRSLKGEKLTDQERAYLERAIQARKKAQQQSGGSTVKGASTDLTPLTDMTAKDRYKGEDGGLYGGGKNEPPAEHLAAALRQARLIRPLDAQGQPAKDGKIVLLSVGMSNTTQVFAQFVKLANQDPDRSPRVVVLDGAQGGMEAQAWAQPETVARAGRSDPWQVLDRRLQQADVTPEQVQVVWIKQARRNPASLGEFPKHAEELKGHLIVGLHKLKEKFPNLRIAYLSSRTYAGYASTGLNPEPYAYESAFVVRWLIRDQMKGDPALNYDPSQGKANAPLLLWGPYLWANGAKGRKSGDLVWHREDFGPDGTHPAVSGRQKVAEHLLRFFKTDPTARTWFTR